MPASPSSGSLHACLATPFGSLHLYADGSEGLSEIVLSPEPAGADEICGHEFIREAVRQFRAYFENPAQFRFSLPIAARGTPFQRRVWGHLSAMAAGETITYGRLAERLESGPRAVAGACRANPTPILVPCHRVVGVRGFGGFCGTNGAGPWRDIKAWLLRHERAEVG